MAGVADDLVEVMTTLLVTVEQLVDAPDPPEGRRTLAIAGLDAAQRARRRASAAWATSSAPHSDPEGARRIWSATR